MPNPCYIMWCNSCITVYLVLGMELSSKLYVAGSFNFRLLLRYPEERNWYIINEYNEFNSMHNGELLFSDCCTVELLY